MPAPLLQAAELDMLLNVDLIERRRSIRSIPCPEAIELDDEASWSTWNELMGQPVDHSVLASAKEAFLSLIRRKLQANESH
jgi:hypothetical protein